MFDTDSLILYVTAFFTASVSGAFGMVGGIILLSVMAQFYKMDVLIPLHGLIQLVSNSSRAAILFPRVNWKIGRVFIIGAILGGFLGSKLVLNISESYYKIGLGIFILWVVFKPKPKNKIEIPGKWFVLGVLAAFLSLFVGAIGMLVGAFFLDEGLEKKQLVATQAICQFFVHTTKVIVFFSVGFVLGPYLGVFSGMIAMTLLGTYFGTRIIDKIPEKSFFVILKILIVLLTARMIVSGLQGLSLL